MYDLVKKGQLLLLTALTQGPCLAQLGPDNVVYQPDLAQPSSLVVADVDQDGDPDIVACSPSYSHLGWLENNGSGVIASFHLITEWSGPINFCRVADLNTDGLPDVFFGALYSADMNWCTNLGGGQFTDPIALPAALTRAQAVDLDNDGDIDLVSDASPGIWCENDGLGNFTDHPIEFWGYDGPFHIRDFDLDGDLDLLTTEPELLFEENDGSGNFTLYTDNVFGFTHGLCADLTGDDIPDLLWDDFGYLGFNPGVGNGSFTEAVEAELDNYVGGMFTMDINNDGLLDLIANATINSNDRLAIYINEGAPSFAFPAAVYPGFGSAVGIAADWDMDGFQDIVCSNSGHIHILRNTGAGGFEAPVQATFDNYSASGLASGDLDMDGVKDIVFLAGTGTQGPKIFWVKAVPGGFSEPMLISAADAENASLCTGDLNGDGMIDVIALYGDQCRWYHNNGNGTFTPYLIATDLYDAGGMAIADLDADGDQDLMIHIGYSELWRYDNVGFNSFSPSLAAYGTSVELRDMNLDGWPDIVSTMGGQFTVGVHLSIGGTDFLPPMPFGSFHYALADLNGDGYMDLGNNGYNEFILRANDGTGVMVPFDTIPDLTIAEGGRGFFMDVDGDTRPDFLTYENTYTPVEYWLNQLPDGGFIGPFNLPGTGDGQFIDHHAADFDGDGDIDLLNYGYGRIGLRHQLSTAGHHAIQGTAFWDINGNTTQDADEPGLVTYVQCEPAPQAHLTNPQGHYQCNTDTGQYTVTAVQPSSLWSAALPIEHVVGIDSSEMVVTGYDFAFVPVVDSMSAAIGYGSFATRCAFTVGQWADLCNDGTIVMEGQLVLSYDTLCEFLSAIPAPDIIGDHLLTWNVDPLTPTACSHVQLFFEMPSSDHVGETLSHHLSFLATDTSGGAPLNFEDDWQSVLQCAVDPNDKQVEPQGYGPQGAIPINTLHLTYTIRFQNTGNDTALNVMIRDPLDTAFDRTTLRILGSSHELTDIEVGFDGVILFHFDGILLPDSGTNEPASHGYVSFTCDLVPGLPHATTIENQVGIFFDYNEAVQTNTTHTTLVDCSLFEPTITEGEPGMLMATGGSAQQWFLNGEPLVGDTAQILITFTPGEFTVQMVNIWGCEALAGPYQVIGDHVNDAAAHGARVVPNPMDQQARIYLKEGLSDDARLELVDVHGHIARSWRATGREVLVEKGGLDAGLYIVRIIDQHAQVAVVRLVVQ